MPPPPSLAWFALIIRLFSVELPLLGLGDEGENGATGRIPSSACGGGGGGGLLLLVLEFPPPPWWVLLLPLALPPLIVSAAVRPLRCPAARPAGRLDHATLRARAAQRPDLWAWRGR